MTRHRAQPLVMLDRGILQAYSRRTTDALRRALAMRVALPHLESFLARNVEKEMRKDAMVIRDASDLLDSGAEPSLAAAQALLPATVEIDSTFLERVRGFPVHIAIPYSQIEPIRLKRIGQLLAASHRILAAGRETTGLRAALRSAYAPRELEHVLLDLLRLYAQETRILSRSLQLPSLLVPLRERFAQSLFAVMLDVSLGLARDAAQLVSRERHTAR